MIDFITTSCIKVTSTAATSATVQIPLDSAGTVPKYVAMKATQTGYVRISFDGSAATDADAMITPGDSLRMCTNKRSFVSFVAHSGNATLQVEPLEFGGYQVAPSDYFSFSAPLTASLAAYGGSTATFTRSTTGTYLDGAGVIQTAAINTPRFQGGKFLSEPARTNLILYSEQFDNAAWIKTVYTVSTNAVVAPDGTLTADKLDESTTAVTDRYIAQYGAAITASAVTTASAYVKDAGRGYCQIRLANGNGTFSTCYYTVDLSTLATVGSGAIAGALSSVSAIALSNGWIRLTVSGALAADVTQAGVQIFGHNGSSTTFAGVVGAGVYVWGAQIEAGNKASSYIPTTAATVTRGADSLTYPVTPSADIGSFCCTIVPAESPATASTNPDVSFYKTASADHFGLQVGSGGTPLVLFVYSAGVLRTSTTIATATAGTTYKVAFTWNRVAGTIRYCVNGGSVAQISSLTLPTMAMDKVSTNAGNPWNGNVSDAKVFNTTLSDATLISITT